MRQSIKPLVFLLFAAGGLPLLYKVFFLQIPLMPQRRPPAFRIEARVSFLGEDSRAQIRLQIPKRHPGFTIENENFESEKFSIRTTTKDAGRTVQWVRTQAEGEYDLFYEATVKALPETRSKGTESPEEWVPPDLSPEERQAVSSLFERVRARTQSLRDQVPLLAEQLGEMSQKDLQLVAGTLKSSAFIERGLRRILTAAGIPAERVRGFDLANPKRNPPMLTWIQVWDGTAWNEFDVDRGTWGVPETYFTWWTGSRPIIDAEGVRDERVTFAITTVDEESSAAMIARSAEKGFVLLYTLPAEVQAVYRVILLIPIGGLIIVLLRNIVGIETFGTFMPVLIALAFRETRLWWGLLLFSVVVGAGLVTRFYFEKLRLLLVPRLAATLTVVIMLLVVVSGFANYIGLDKGPSVALFPMVIMTMAIERMSVQWEESGPHTALRLGAMTLAAAMLVYAVITNEYLAYILFTFPELLFIVLASAIMLGRYTGYRLCEGWRFRSLAGPAA